MAASALLFLPNNICLGGQAPRPKHYVPSINYCVVRIPFSFFLRAVLFRAKTRGMVSLNCSLQRSFFFVRNVQSSSTIMSKMPQKIYALPLSQHVSSPWEDKVPSPDQKSFHTSTLTRSRIIGAQQQHALVFHFFVPTDGGSKPLASFVFCFVLYRIFFRLQTCVKPRGLFRSSAF